jgi:hypothetical protein
MAAPATASNAPLPPLPITTSVSVSTSTEPRTTQPATSATSAAPPPELEQILNSLVAHRSVLGYMVLSLPLPPPPSPGLQSSLSMSSPHPLSADAQQGRSQPHAGGGQASIIRHSGVIFEGEQGRKYASVVKRIVEAARSGYEEIGDGSVSIPIVLLPSLSLLSSLVDTFPSYGIGLPLLSI